MSVVNGSAQVALKWSYTLPAGTVPRTTRFRIIKGASAVLGSIFHDSSGDTYQLLDARFNISRGEQATFIINKVTEREEAVYECELETRAADIWSYNIRLIVTGENCYLIYRL